MTQKNENIIPYDHTISLDDREKNNGHKAAVFWFTGLSGSGKSSLSNALQNHLFSHGYQTYILDGDNVRSGLNSDLDFSEAGRTENIRRISELAALFKNAGFITLSAFISPFAKDRELARTKAGNEAFFEIFVDCPLEVCEERDVKGLYEKARKGLIKDFTGISSPFEEPENPDLTLKTHEFTEDECLAQLIRFVEEKVKINE
jgi:adenylylsulfate kinase